MDRSASTASARGSREHKDEIAPDADDVMGRLRASMSVAVARSKSGQGTREQGTMAPIASRQGVGASGGGGDGEIPDGVPSPGPDSELKSLEGLAPLALARGETASGDDGAYRVFALAAHRHSGGEDPVSGDGIDGSDGISRRGRTTGVYRDSSLDGERGTTDVRTWAGVVQVARQT